LARLANELPLGLLKHGREEGVGPSRQPVQVEFRHWEILAIICDKSAGLLDGNCGYDDVRQSDCFAFFGPKVFKSSCVLPRTRVERKAFQGFKKCDRASFLLRTHLRVNLGDVDGGSHEAMSLPDQLGQKFFSSAPQT
jgi:hypothetical protein